MTLNYQNKRCTAEMTSEVRNDDTLSLRITDYATTNEAVGVYQKSHVEHRKPHQTGLPNCKDTRKCDCTVSRLSLKASQ